MKKLITILLLSTALLLPRAAIARDVIITAELKSYRGPGAYLAVYLTKPDGRYDSTLWIAGEKQKYYGHLRGWVRAVSRSGESVDGLTGASVGSGRTLNITANLSDAMIDAGYQIHVDTAVEDGGEHTNDAVVSLSKDNKGMTVGGRGFIRSLSVSM
ncbi:MAG: DUF2271 domain-containing protein [Cohaesibacteraceae bacterium]|nr:DUF2271 domain-containing protein [Cohaesibacteraceae bacterium]